MTAPVIVILGASGLETARRIKAATGGVIHGPSCVVGAERTYGKAAAHLRALFEAGATIIGVCASAILIRALAPFLKDKRAEPPVIAVSEDGASVVPLLGGHHGANDLARRIATALDAHAAITTASDVRLGFAFDEPPEGYVLANPEDAKSFASRVLSGEGVDVAGAMPGLPRFEGALEGLTLEVTEHPSTPSEVRLVYHPRTLAIGVGCERGAAADEIVSLISQALKDAGLASASVASLNSIDLKEDETGLTEASARLRLPLRFFDAATLNAEAPRLKNPSETVLRETGCPGVAEGAALAAAGPDAELVVEKRKSARATVAVARAPAPLTDLKGRSRGFLSVVGLGPGDPMTRSPEASAALRAASDWVGYGLYLDLAADLLSGQAEHRFPLGAEEERVRHAIALARAGRNVALICSGDPGIYAMAALVFEIIDLAPERIGVAVIPGISAFQAAAARAGAMIGHDFCCVSLSDLLTPWEVIEARLHAAAAGDFVTAFYNPRSLARRDQLARAIEIFKSRRPPSTPVIVASNLGRPEERTTILPLAEFDPAAVDMLTLVMIGSSQSKTFTRGDGRAYAYTPRGYAKKREP